MRVLTLVRALNWQRGTMCPLPLTIARVAYHSRSSSHRRAHTTGAGTARSEKQPSAARSVRSTEKLRQTAQHRLSVLLNDAPSSAPRPSAEAELRDAMDALTAYRNQTQQEQQQRQQPPSDTPLRGVQWTAAAVPSQSRPGIASTRTLADLQRADDARTASQPPTGTDERRHDPSAGQAPTTAVDRRAAMLYATLLHWLVVAAHQLSPDRLAAYQSALFALLVPPTAPRMGASARSDTAASAQLARSLWRRGAKAYVELLVHVNAAPRSADEWCHLRAVLAVGESFASLQKRVEGSNRDEAGAIDDVCPGTRTLRVMPRAETTAAAASIPRAGNRAAVLCVAAVPLLPSSDAWTLRVHGQPRFASQRGWTSWRSLYAVLTWSLQWDAPSSSASVSSSSSQATLHVESRDILAVLTACLQEEARRGTPLQGATAQTIEALKDLWQRAREAERRFPALATACAVDKTTHQRLAIDGYKVVMLSPGEETPAESADGEVELPGGRRASFASTTSQYNRWAALGLWDRIGHDLAAQSAPLLPTGATEETALWGQWPPVRLATLLHAHVVARLPENRLRAPETAAERHMLANPPTRGLAVLAPHTRKGTRRADEAALIVALRQRLWCLAKAPLPPHVARTVVCFTHHASPAPIAAVVGYSPRLHAPSRGGAGGARVRPFVWRVPAKEWLPWYLVASVGALLSAKPLDSTAETEAGAGLQASVLALQKRVWPTLFRPLEDYAAFHEHCADVYVQMARLQPADRRGGGGGVGGGRGDSADGDGWVRAAWWLFWPSLARCRATGDVDAAAPRSLDALEADWLSLKTTPLTPAVRAEVTRPALPSATASVYADIVLDAALFAFLAHKVGQTRNYHVSLALETLSRCDGAALHDLLSAWEEEYTALGPVVLGPESAAAVTTALILFLLPVLLHSATDADPESAQGAALDAVAALLSAHHCTHLYFAVPAQKNHSVSSFFKAIHDPSFLSRCISSANATASTPLTSARGWEGAEALLVGRSLRVVDRFPTTTTAAFFHLQPSTEREGGGIPVCTFDPPVLTYELFCVDVLAALAHFLAQSQRTAVSASVVATDLPYGLLAVNKPAGVSCTLHAASPSLIPFLAVHAAWRSRARDALVVVDNKEAVTSRLLASTVPALHQHGLVNRIDLGTSGLVLATRDHEALRVAIDATLVQHRLRKVYQALVQYTPPPPNHWSALSTWFLPAQGVITSAVYAHGVADPAAFLALHTQQHLCRPADRRRLSTALLDRRPAHTRFRVLEYFPRHGVYHVEVALDSGRRHQIRQHFASLLHPLVGDTRYHGLAATHGARVSWGLARPALHASAIHIVVPHGEKGEADDGEEEIVSVVRCPLPDDMERVLRELRAADRGVSAHGSGAR